jgi:DNA-directed RNA polymerase II subunit RPB3
LDPDQIVQLGIKTLQTKLATVIHELSGGPGPDGADFGGAQSPTLNGAGYGGPDAGYTTPGYGGASQWGGAGGVGQGGTTPYGATPYGQNW